MKNFKGKKYAYIYRLNTKIRLIMLCLSGFELYSRWVPPFNRQFPHRRELNGTNSRLELIN